MDRGRQYRDLGQGFAINSSNLPSLDQWIKSSLFKSMVEIYCAVGASDFSNLKLYLPQENFLELWI
jgi:hypothetical protein